MEKKTDEIFHPSLAAALIKLDPEDGEKILEYLKTHAMLSREKALLQASVRDQKKLLVENGKLKKDIEQLRAQLTENQRRHNVKAPPLSPAPSPPVNQTAAVPAEAPPPPAERRNRRRRGERRALPLSLPLSLPPSLPLSLLPVDVSRLDLRVGKILSVCFHPQTEKLLLQRIDVGEENPRTVISQHGQQGNSAVLLCNVRACKLRGVVSQARLLCCVAPDDRGCEILTPPTNSEPGDRVTVLDYPGDPDKELPSKQKLWELLQPDLQVDSRGVATYKGCAFQVKGKGLCRAPSLTNCAIR